MYIHLSLWLVFWFFDSDFCRAELFTLLQSNSAIFPFIDCGFGIVSKNSSPNPRPLRFPNFFCKFHNTAFYTKVYEIFGLIWRKVSRLCMSSFFPHSYPIFPALLVEKIFLLHWIAFVLFAKISWLYFVGLFLACLCVQLIYESTLSPTPYCLDSCTFKVSLEI